MSNLREEITRTALRLSRRREGSHAYPGHSAHTKIREGKQLGYYRILKKLGGGGMGDVYLALDTRLGRHVALKFLASDRIGNYATLYRLQQEARTASALNHPNIVTVYEIGELEGEAFIASEFIDGATLRVAIQRKSIDPPNAIDVAIQIASALVAAHAAGVVHRDLKPGNIMLRRDGYVKVIDFGLAKQITKSTLSPSRDEFATQPGSVIGTVDYMSPEQARGDKVDHRTDIWSLGVVLYEMVAHRRPFAGKTESHTIVSILDAPLPPLPETESVPAGLAPILEGALAKDPLKRYSSVGEMLTALQHISPKSAHGSGIRLVFEPHPATRKKTVPIASAALVISLIVGLAWWWTRRTPDWFQVGSVRQLTFNSRTRLATISPDGKYLAFVVGETGGDQTLYLKQIDTPTEQLRIPPRKIDYEGLTFSPDSGSLFETEKDGSKLGRLYAMPIVGGQPTVPVIQDIDGPVSFSPEGDQIAFVRYIVNPSRSKYESESAIFIASLDGFKQHREQSRPDTWLVQQHPLVSLTDSSIYKAVAWSPRGDRLAAVLFSNLPGHAGESMLDLIDLRGGRESRRLLPDWRLIGKPSWMPDAKSLILTAALRTQTRSQVQIRQITVDSGRTHDVTVGLAGFRDVSLTRTGTKLIAAKSESRATLWVSAPQNLTSGQTFEAEADERPVLAWLDATHVILNSQRSGYPNLWLLDLGSRNGDNLTNEQAVQQDAVSSPDGRAILFASNRTGQSKIWRLDRDEAIRTQLTFGPDYDESPTISPDGKWIVYTSWTGNVPHLRKIPAGGGQSVQIGLDPAQEPQISPDGQSIACYMLDPNTGTWGVAVIPFGRSATPFQVPAAQPPFRWSPDGKSLTTVRTDDKGVSNVWSVPLSGSAGRQLTTFENDSIATLAWSQDGTRLACVRVRLGADIALFSRQASP